VPASSDRFIEKVRGLEARGAVMLGHEMIDEASHKMAQAIAAKGRAAGLPS
jgi:citrate lyase beta subunit